MATYYFTGNIDNNWGTAGNWSTTSGGSGNGAVPTSADDAIFDGSSPNCTVNTTGRVCKTINFSTYTNTITMSNTITVSGNVTLGASMGIAGASALIVNTTGNLTSNGKTWSNDLNLTGNLQTYTLIDNWTVSGSLLLTGFGTITITGTFNINVGGSLSVGATTTTSGTATIVMNGTGSYGHSSNPILQNNLTINTSGTVTISGNVYFYNKTFRYISGTTVTTGSTLNTQSSTFAASGMTFNSISTGNMTLLEDLNVNGLFSTQAGGTINGSFTVNCNGGATPNNGFFNGTATISLNGGTWSGGAGFIATNVNINGNVTIASPTFQTATLKYLSGTVTVTGTPRLGGSLDVSGITWNNLSLFGTTTLLSDLNISGLTTFLNTTTINGSFRVNCNGGISDSGQAILGTSTLSLNGGTWSGSGGGYFGINTNINGNVTISGVVTFGTPGRTLTYISGTTTTSGSTLRMVDNSILNTSGMTWNNIAVNYSLNSSTITLTSDCNVSGNLLMTNVTTINGAFNMNVGGNLTIGATPGAGTSTIVLNGTGTWSGNFRLRNNLRINTPGTITISGSVQYDTGTLTHVSGTTITTGSTLTVAAATPIVVNNSGFTLNNVNTTANVTFSGTSGCDINGTYTCTTPGTTHTFGSTLTYNINSLNIAGTNASRVTFRSTTSGSKALINLSSIQSEYYLNVTDINGSGGAAGWTFGGTLSNTDNWNSSTSLYYVGVTNFSASGSWSPYSGGVGITSMSAPASTDDIVFDTNSGACTMNVAGVCKSVTFATYTNTITMTNGLTVSGNVTLGAGMTIAGAGTLTVNATTIITSNGKTWPNTLVLAGSITITLIGDLTINGLFSLNTSPANTVMTFNGTVNINCYSGFTNNSDGGTGTSQGTGTTTLNIYGGTWSGQGMTRLDTNIIGDVTISTVRFTVRKLTYVSGNVTCLGSSWISGTLDVGGIMWNDLFNGTGTLLSDLNVRGILGINNGGYGGAFNINCYGGISVSSFLQNATGASAPTINLYGGTFCPTAASQGFLTCIINIIGNITFGTVVLDQSNTVRYISGNVKGTSTSSLIITQNGNTLLNFDKINTIRTVTITGTRSVTMNKFFNGTTSTPTRIQCSTTTGTYAVAFQDGIEKVAKNVKVSGCIVSNRNQLLLTSINANKGNNFGVRYINQLPNGNPLKYVNTIVSQDGGALMADPSFIVN